MLPNIINPLRGIGLGGFGAYEWHGPPPFASSHIVGQNVAYGPAVQSFWYPHNRAPRILQTSGPVVAGGNYPEVVVTSAPVSYSPLRKEGGNRMKTKKQYFKAPGTRAGEFGSIF